MTWWALVCVQHLSIGAVRSLPEIPLHKSSRPTGMKRTERTVANVTAGLVMCILGESSGGYCGYVVTS